MKVNYDPQTDTLRIILSSQPIEHSEEEPPRVVSDYDEKENVAGLEILDASHRTDNPRSVEYAVAG